MNVQSLGLLSNVLIRVKKYLKILLNKYFSGGWYFNVFCVASISILVLNIKTVLANMML